MARKIERPDAIELDISPIRKELEIDKKIDQKVEQKNETKPNNVLQASIESEKKEIAVANERAKQNKNFKQYIPPRKTIKERKVYGVYLRTSTYTKLKKIAKNKNYSVGEIIDFLVEGASEE